MDITIKGYQRNGVCGNGFFTAFGVSTEIEEAIPLIITFETDLDLEGDNVHETVVIESCRVVSPFHLGHSWRGDRFGDAIQKAVRKVFTKYPDLGFFELIGQTIDIGEI